MLPLKATGILQAGWALLPPPAVRTKPSVVWALPWPFQAKGRREHWQSCNGAHCNHLEGDQQRVQSGGLLRGGHRLAAGLQFADGNPADALEGLVGLHLLQGDNEDVALFVFDRLEEDLPQVLDAQQPLRNGMGGQEKAADQVTSSRHGALWVWAARI